MTQDRIFKLDIALDYYKINLHVVCVRKLEKDKEILVT